MQFTFFKKIYPLVILVIILFSFYFFTLSRSVYLEDSAEFVAASHTLSNAHPSGYPTYLMTAKIISLVPFLPSVVEKINFVSLFWTILAVMFLYLSLIKLFGSRTLAFGLGFLFGISPMVWTQATYAEVYSLNTFFIVLLLWLWLRYQEKQSNKRIYLIIFFYGLSLTNHFLPLIFLPLIVIWILKNYPLKNRKFYLKSVAVFILGLTPYLYIPIRSAMQPAFDWAAGGATGVLTYNIAYGHKISKDTFIFLSDFVKTITDSLGWLGLALVLASLVLLIKQRNSDSETLRQKSFRFFVGASLVLSSFAMIIVITNGREYDYFAGWFYQFLHIPFLVVIILLLGFFLKTVLKKNKLAFFGCLFLLLLWPTSQLGNRFLNQDKSQYVFLENYTKTILEELPDNAEIFIYHDHIVTDPIIFGLAYLRYTRGLRDDVTVHTLNPVWPMPADFSYADMKLSEPDSGEFLKKYINDNVDDKNNVYTSFSWSENGKNKNTGVGLIYYLGETEIGLKKNVLYAADNLALPSAADNPFQRSLLAKYYYDLAVWAYGKGAIKSGQWFLNQGIEYDLEPFSDYYNDVVNWRNNYLAKIDENKK